MMNPPVEDLEKDYTRQDDRCGTAAIFEFPKHLSIAQSTRAHEASNSASQVKAVYEKIKSSCVRHTLVGNNAEKVSFLMLNVT